mmetsp:Transcript_14605/g.16210  ORF Transcript_14605/g.16210 Transcript_14605/m.16210 type:complete len:180 (-) Transcript_14605:39-578(-)
MLKIWDVKSRNFRPIQTMEDAMDSISSLYIYNYEIITGSVDGRLRTYDIRMGELRTDVIDEAVTSVCMSNDGNIILAGTLDSTIRLLDKSDGTLYSEYTGHVNKEFKITSMFTGDDAYVVSGSEDGKIVYWSLETADKVGEIQKHRGLVCGLDHHPEKPIIVSAGVDKQVRLWGTSKKK